MKGSTLLVFLLSLTLYVICLDPGASFWDCPEYILAAWRLEITHPPGNPTWQLMANAVAHFGGSPKHAAILINLTSAVATALSAALLASIIRTLLLYSFFRGKPGSRPYRLATFCSVCGALCFAWCDSTIFSAVEAEVYALAIFFTALLLWLTLRWARLRTSDPAAASRSAILTAYILGLSMGVHELNLLTLPAMGLIYLYAIRDGRKSSHPPRRARGMRSLGWCALFFCIGCSTYLLIPLRAAANPPVNQGAPSDLTSFRKYYSRQQYGSKPLIYGRTPLSYPLRREEWDSEGNPIYTKYYIAEEDGIKSYVYPDELNMWFPRMTSTNPADFSSYKAWAGMDSASMVEVEAAWAVDTLGRQTGRYDPDTGKRIPEKGLRPTYAQQLRYMLGYQMGYMYLRYLMWNFSGRQNNFPSTGEIDHGNFITGFPAIDNLMLGPQDMLPAELREDNAGYNRYFLIPFLFGVAGAVMLGLQGRRGRRACAVVAALFLMTGICLVIYLNQDPGEPRERDYSFLGSFMAFAIWIACGMAALVRRWPNALTLALCALVPLLMVSQTYDDHLRSGRYSADDTGANILNSLPENAILFLEGDNYVFPVWYAQEVLGIRRDVTPIVQAYVGTEWYLSRLRIPGEESLPIAMPDSLPAAAGGRPDEGVRGIVEHNSHRPIYWITFSSSKALGAMKEDASSSLFTYRLRRPGEHPDEARANALREGFEATGKLKSGGTGNFGFRMEPYVADVYNVERLAMFDLARRLGEEGDSVKARTVVERALELWPFEIMPPRRVMRDETLVDEALIASELLEDEGIMNRAMERRKAFERYYRALPPGRRDAVSRQSMVVFAVIGSH